MSSDTNTRALCTVNGDRCIPANPGAKTALNVFITREIRLIFRRDSVQIIGGGHHGHTQMKLFGPFEQAQHDLSGPLMTGLRYDSIEGIVPLVGFLWIRVHLVK